MVASLFSAFEPSYGLTSVVFATGALLVTVCSANCLFMISHSFTKMIKTVQQSIKIEIESMINPENKNFTNLLISLMTMILCMNLVGIMPYTFTSTTHISFTFPLAISVWSTFMIYGWATDVNSRLSALLPSGTPSVLMPLMVLIESVSILIRPLSLSVRLTANMVTGHLLLSLVGGGFESGFLISSFGGQSLLMVLELAVAGIQAYVFTVLTSLYSKETYAEINSILQE